MPNSQLLRQLQELEHMEDFTKSSSALVETWKSSNAGIDGVEAILRFMESHPNINFGLPGPLVHFAELFYGKGYEDKLVESIRRKPTQHTVWMLNRIINGTKSKDRRNEYIAVLKRARLNSALDKAVLQQIHHFLRVQLGNP